MIQKYILVSCFIIFSHQLHATNVEAAEDTLIHKHIIQAITNQNKQRLFTKAGESYGAHRKVQSTAINALDYSLTKLLKTYFIDEESNNLYKIWEQHYSHIVVTEKNLQKRIQKDKKHLKKLVIFMDSVVRNPTLVSPGLQSKITIIKNFLKS